MDRGTLLLIALALLSVAGFVLGVVGVILFRRDRKSGVPPELAAEPLTAEREEPAGGES